MAWEYNDLVVVEVMCYISISMFLKYMYVNTWH